MKRSLSRSPSPTIPVSTPWAPRKRRRHSIPYGATASCASVKAYYETPSPKRRHTSKRQRRAIYDKDKGYETDIEFFAGKSQRLSSLPRTSAPHPSPSRPFQNTLVRLNIKDDMDLVTALDDLYVSRRAHVRNKEPSLNGVLCVLSKTDEDETRSVTEEDVNEREKAHVYGGYGAAEKGNAGEN